MRNSLLTGLMLLAAGSFAVAQQAPPAAIAPKSLSGIGVSNSQGYYVDRSFDRGNFKEEDLKSKEVSKEITAPKNGDVYIENAYRGIVVKTWDQQKVKITTTVFYAGEITLTDEEWLDKAGVSLKTLGTSVKIKSGSSSNNGLTFYSYNGTASMSNSVTMYNGNGNGQNNGSKTNLKRVVTITVPTGSKLDIESKYADVQLPANIGDVNVDISNGNLEAENLGKFILRSKYSTINVGDIKTAEVEFTNGRFSAKNIDDLDIESKYSTIEMAMAKKITLRSTNDEYELEEAGEVRGKKNYGNLRITKLNNSLELDGTNADVKVRNVGPALSMIKVEDKYADVRIPLRSVKNYTIDFAGSYSSVYGNFDKKAVTDAKEEKGSLATVGASEFSSLNRYPVATRSGTSWSDTPSRFTATVGDGKGLKLDIRCQNCTVDFK